MPTLDETLILNITVGITVAAFCLAIGILLWRRLRDNESLKYEFITIIAHKFRTPLTQIKWNIEGLLGNEIDPYKKGALAEIGVSNENLIKLTNTLIELTDSASDAKSSYQMERLNLCEMAHAALEVSKRDFHEKNLFMSMNYSVSEIFVNADKARIEFVLGTLMENAGHYTPPGRNVTVTVSADKHKAAISITDDGIGMDNHEIARIFDKFYRSKGAQSMDTEGVGVGLYLAKAIVKRHGGTIEAFSEGTGKGSTFSVILPRVE